MELKLYLVTRYLTNAPKINLAWAESPEEAVELILPGAMWIPDDISGEWDRKADIAVYPAIFSDVDAYYGGNSDKVINPLMNPSFKSENK